jgi:hypothetical protein
MMRTPLFLFLLFCLTQSAIAGNPPRWRMKHPQTSATGITFDLRKAGKGALPETTDQVVVNYFKYKSPNSTFAIEDSRTTAPQGVTLRLNDRTVAQKFRDAVCLLRKGGRGYFLWTSPNPVSGTMDTVYYYIQLLHINRSTAQPSILTEPPADSVRFPIADRDQPNFGDSTIHIATLVELPALLPGCDSQPGKQQYVMLKFRERYFENGVKYRDLLVAVPCVDNYEAGFFVPGQRYLITALSWHQGDDLFREIADSYGTKTPELKRYRALRITKG